MYCNVCGRKIYEENGILKEDIFQGKKEWGYFSQKDLEIHKFHICEQCYQKMIDNFIIPVEKSYKKEAL